MSGGGTELEIGGVSGLGPGLSGCCPRSGAGIAEQVRVAGSVDFAGGTEVGDDAGRDDAERQVDVVPVEPWFGGLITAKGVGDCL